MAYPSAYDRQFNFQNQQALTPDDPVPAEQLDAEYNAIKLALDGTQANLALIQRDDGALANGAVGVDQLSEELAAALQPPLSLLQYVEEAKEARDDAEDAAADAQLAKEAAEAAKTDAETAEGEAEAARDLAVAAKEDAITAQLAAEAAQSGVDESAGAAQAAAAEALLSQTAAENAQGAAENAQSAAEDAQLAAENAQSAAEQAQSDAETALETFSGVFYGAAASDPSTDPNGDPVDEGDLYYNTSDGELKAYNGVSWVTAAGPGGDPYVQKVSVLKYIPENLHADILAGTSTTDVTSYIQDALDNEKWVEIAGRLYTEGTVELNEGNILDGPGTIYYQDSGIAVSATGDNCTVQNLTLLGTYINTYESNSIGISATDFSIDPEIDITWFNNLTIRNVEIAQFGDTAIRVNFCRRASIVHNYIHHCAHRGVLLLSPQHCDISHNTIDTLTPGRNDGLMYGIALARASGSPILRVADAPPARHCTIAHNRARNILNYVAYDLHGGQDCVIDGNITEDVVFGINLEHASCTGTCGSSGNSTTAVNLGANAVPVDDYYNGCTIVFTSGTGGGNTSGAISDYDGATKIATVAALGFTPDDTSRFTLFESGAGVPTHNVVVNGNKLQGLESSAAAQAGIALDAQSGAGEISEGVIISNNVLRGYGRQTGGGGFFGSQDAAIVLGYADAPIVTGNHLDGCFGRGVSIRASVRGAVVSSNAFVNLAVIDSTISFAIDLVSAGSSAVCNGNALIAANSAVRMFSSVVPDGARAGLMADQSNMCLGNSLLFATNAKARLRGGSLLFGAQVMVVWDADGTIQYMKINDCQFNPASVVSVAKNTTGDFTVTLPAGIVIDSSSKAIPYYNAADATSDQVMSSTCMAAGLQTFRCKSYNRSSALVDCADNVFMLFGV